MKIDNKKTTKFEFIVTNAQSMNAKAISLADTFISISPGVVIITETWFNCVERTKGVLDDLKHSFGIHCINKDRKGKRGGGVAIFFNPKLMSLKEHKFRSSPFELVAARGKR